MGTVSSYFNAPWAYQKDRDNLKEYGTCDLDEIERIEAFNDKNVEKRAEELANEKAETRFNEIKDKFELDTIRKVEEAYLIKKGEKPFLSAASFHCVSERSISFTPRRSSL